MIASPSQSIQHATPARPAEPRRIQSIDVGFRLIRALEAASHRLSLKDLAAAAGMAPSKALLYLASFVALGMAARDAAGRYSLGPYALQLGLAALRQLNVVDAAAEPMQALLAATHQSVYLSIWGNRGPSIVAKLDHDSAVPMEIRVGYVLPLATSATGRVYLAHLPCPMTQPLLAQGYSAKPLSARALDSIVSTVRRDGVAASDSQLNLGFAALAAPIFDHRGELAAALTVLGPSARIDTNPRHALATRLRTAAATISHRLGLTSNGRAHSK